MRKPHTSFRLVALLFVIASAGPSASTTLGISTAALTLQKLDSTLQHRVSLPTGRSRVIVRGVEGIVSTTWSARIMWGNHVIQGGRLSGDANAWANDVTWGTPLTPAGQIVEWGIVCATTACDTVTGPWRWGDVNPLNIVWGLSCGGADCETAWSGDLVWGLNDEGDTVVWGTSDEGDTVVWGTSDEGDTVVWGTSCTDPSCDPVIWKSD